jgi:glutamate synthase domain-containing protein 3|tara:strand:- start:1790 stop:2044 length:255 start_codon:yes stop_codon:yes gene_type:complete
MAIEKFYKEVQKEDEVFEREKVHKYMTEYGRALDLVWETSILAIFEDIHELKRQVKKQQKENLKLINALKLRGIIEEYYEDIKE